MAMGAEGFKRLEAKRNLRWQPVHEIEEKIEAIRREDRGGLKEGALATAASRIQEHHVKGKWFERYKEEKEGLWDGYLTEIEKKIKDQRTWRVTVASPTEGTRPFRKPVPAPMVRWQRMAWPRNFYCEMCMGVAGPGPDVLDCCTCNVVMHYACVLRKMGPPEVGPKDWQCPFCENAADSERADYEEGYLRHIEQQRRFRVAIKLQAKVRAWLERSHYRTFLRRLAHAQAVIRRFITFRRFKRFMRAVWRLYKVKVVEVGDLSPLERDPTSTLCTIVVSVITERRSLPSDGEWVDPEKQLFRFETTTFHHGNVRLNQQIVIPGSTSQVMLAFTVVRKDGVRMEFWGQGFLDGQTVLEKKCKVRLNLGEMKFEPRDRRSTVPLKNRLLEDKAITGYVNLEFTPVPLYSSKCSFVNEVADGTKDQRTVRQWWACLVDCYLLLYKKYGDAVPNRTMVVLKVAWFNRTALRVIALKNDESFAFTVPDPDVRSDWYYKLRLAAKQDVSALAASGQQP